jgi:hypothetical protein
MNVFQGASLILQEFTIHHGNIWFIKLDTCIPLGIFAVGNAKGKIAIFPLGPEVPEEFQSSVRTEDSTTERYQFEKSCHALTTIAHPR